MAASVTNFLFALLCILSTFTYTQAELCALVGIPDDTSKTNPYELPTISDNVDAGETVWENEFEGNVTRTAVDGSSDFQYLGARLVELQRTYLISTNDLTRSFTKYQRRRDITRYINMFCGEETSVRYYFKVPVEDVTPPAFERGVYTFNITADWNPRLPITDGQHVIVGDNAFELGTGELSLSFGLSQDNIVEILPVKMWEEGSKQDVYKYSLHLFIHEGLILQRGEVFEIVITADDQFNTAHTTIIINVL